MKYLRIVGLSMALAACTASIGPEDRPPCRNVAFGDGRAFVGANLDTAFRAAEWALNQSNLQVYQKSSENLCVIGFRPVAPPLDTEVAIGIYFRQDENSTSVKIGIKPAEVGTPSWQSEYINTLLNDMQRYIDLEE